MKTVFAAAVLLIALPTMTALPCTTFCLRTKTAMLVGNNYDYDTGVGLLIVNKHGVAKVSTTEDDGNPAKWISKYGSVTFNQFGRENPNGGMNEKGLVVAIMWLNEAAYPKDGKEPTVDLLEWVQYQLDTAATVAEVLKNIGNIRIDPQLPGIKIHYLVADADGNAATIEYIGGKAVVHTGTTLPEPILTNNTYDDSTAYLRKASLDKAITDGSLDRFFRASHKLHESPAGDPVKYAFSILDNVRSAHYTSSDDTVWSIVYDQKAGVIHFRTKAIPVEKTVDMRKFDYSCGSPVKVLDVDTNIADDVTASFTGYTRKANRDLIAAAFKGSSLLQFIPASLIDADAAYPEDFRCIPAK